MKHWYTITGLPRHTQKTKAGAKNAERPTNIADARALHLFPSVSTITKLLALPKLELWAQEQVAVACFNNPPHPGEEQDGYVKAMVEKSKEGLDQAAATGKIIHAALEAALRGTKSDVTTVKIDHMEYHIDEFVVPVLNLIKENAFRVISAETVLVNSTEGYAGTTDLIINTKDGQPGIIDFKSKRTKRNTQIKPSETHAMQIAAYSMAAHSQLGFGANIYISTTEPGRVEMVKYGFDKLNDDWKAFLSLRNLWIWQNDYDPRT